MAALAKRVDCCCCNGGDREKWVLSAYPLNAGNWVWWARDGLTMTPGVLFMLTATAAELFGLFGVKLVTGDSGSEGPVVEGEDEDEAEAEIFAVGGMSIVRVSLPKMSRNRLVGAGNAVDECFGGVRAAAAAIAAVTGPNADGCRITEGCCCCCG